VARFRPDSTNRDWWQDEYRKLSAIGKSPVHLDRYQGIDHTFVQLYACETSVLIALCRPMQSDVHSEQQRRRNMKIVMVLTSHDQLGNTGRKTGF
jgi:hypothetical protein